MSYRRQGKSHCNLGWRTSRTTIFSRYHPLPGDDSLCPTITRLMLPRLTASSKNTSDYNRHSNSTLHWRSMKDATVYFRHQLYQIWANCTHSVQRYCKTLYVIINNKKLSYCRDSARCVKRPFKVTQSHPLLCQSTRHNMTSYYHLSLYSNLTSIIYIQPFLRYHA